MNRLIHAAVIFFTFAFLVTAIDVIAATPELL